MRYNRRALLAMILIIAAGFPVFAMQQRGRDSGIIRTTPSASSTNIEAIARDLSDKSQDAWNTVYNQRARTPAELYVALAGFAASTKAYWQMAADAREDLNLRNSARRIVAAAVEIDALLSSTQVQSLREAWRFVQPHVAALSDAYNLGYTVRGRPASQDRLRGLETYPTLPAAGGRFRWRGQVDGSDYIMLQGSQVTVRHLEFNPIGGASFELPNPLPQTPVQVSLTKIKGRGQVEIVRQPTAENNYTVTVWIEDSAGGDDLYEFELNW